MAASVYSELKTSIEAINKDFKEGYQASKASHKRMGFCRIKRNNAYFG